MKILRNNKVLTLLVLSFVLFLAAITLLIFTYGNNWEDRSNMFTSVSSIFSVMALLGTIYTINLQRKELKLQREELENNRKELSISSDAQMSLTEIEWLKLMLSEPVMMKKAFHVDTDDEEQLKKYAISYFFLELMKSNYSNNKISHDDFLRSLKGYLKDQDNLDYLEQRCKGYDHNNYANVSEDCPNEYFPNLKICLIKKFNRTVCREFMNYKNNKNTS